MTRNAIYFLILGVLLGISIGDLRAQTDPAITIGKKERLFSKVLNEERELWVYLPRSYYQSSDTYPVLYLLDGASHFEHVAALVEYLSNNLRIPQTIVVAIPNTDRVRDFTPLHSLVGLDGKIDTTIFATTGGGDNFLKFLKQELIPHFDKNYRTQPYRILEGHSLGGMFATYCLEAAPELFQSYLIMSAAFYGKNMATLTNLAAFLQNHKTLSGNVYVAIGQEPIIQPGVDSLVQQFKAYSPKSLRWKYKRYDDEDHGSVTHLAMYDGLRFIYPDWWIDLNDPKHGPSLEDVEEHFSQQTKRYGYEIKPTLQALLELGYFNIDVRKVDDAIAVFEKAVSQYPAAASAYTGLGDACRLKGKRGIAIKNYEKAISLNPTSEYAKRNLMELTGSKK